MSRPSLEHTFVPFAQLALLGAAIHVFEIEEAAGLPTLVPIVVVGYLVHAWLPARFKVPFFLLLSVVAAAFHLGTHAVGVFAVGLGLFGLAHLPVKVPVRIAVVALAVAALAVVRAGVVEVPALAVALPVVASLFMFRMILYLREPAPAQVDLWTRLSYFFLLPNVFFPLFPIVDWAAFRKAPSTPLPELHQRGVQWIGRGVLHLLAYRLVYHLAIPATFEIDDAATSLQWIGSSWLVYLRISGQFHLVVGILLLFDRDLPETHHLYFFARGASDYWRRVNVYWTSFVEKIAFFPTFLRLRRLGTPQPLVLAVLATFLATWTLHAWQWFWLRGDLLLTGPDTLFWVLFGLLVAANSLWDASRKRAPSARAGLGGRLRVALQTVATFCGASVLWSLWSSDSLAEWADRLLLLAVGPEVWGVVAGLAAAAVVLGVLLQYAAAVPSVAGLLRRLDTGRNAGVSLVVCAAILGLGMAPRSEREAPWFRAVRDAIATERLNEQDLIARTQGYYENLQPRAAPTGELWRTEVEMPPGWQRITESSLGHNIGGVIKFELFPSVRATFNGARFSTNSWGMRDEEYPLEKPPRVYRIALLGSSYLMGSGVADDEVFEAIVEERLNREFAGGKYDRYEILNFSCGGYTLATNVAIYEERARNFDPDAIIVGDHENEGNRLIHQFATTPHMMMIFPNPKVRALYDELGIGGMPEEARERRLQPLQGSLTRMLFHQLAADARADEAKLAWLYVPLTRLERKLRDEFLEGREAWAREAHMIPMSLEGAYGDREQHEVALAPWDEHPNPAAHRMLAEAFYRELVEHSAALGMGLER